MFRTRLTVVFCVTCLLIAFAFVLSASPAQAGGNGVVESVTGSSHMTVPLSVFDPSLEGDAEMRTLSYNALRHGDGSVSGHYEYHIIVQDVSDVVRGTVVCLKVEGNRAWIGATVDATTDPTVEGLFSWWQVEDNGQGASAPADRTTFLGFGTLDETFDYCQGPDPNFIFDIDHGNIKVRDAD
jgi:hypothetical protein